MLFEAAAHAPLLMTHLSSLVETEAQATPDSQLPFPRKATLHAELNVKCDSNGEGRNGALT